MRHLLEQFLLVVSINFVDLGVLLLTAFKQNSSVPIAKEDLNILMAEVYIDGELPASLRQVNLHRLSLLLMVFAMGALFDVEKPLCPSEAEAYHSLARAALSGDEIFNNTTLDCVQSMVHINL